MAEGHEIFVVDGHGSRLDFLANEAMHGKEVEVCILVPNASEKDQVSRTRRGSSSSESIACN